MILKAKRIMPLLGLSAIALLAHSAFAQVPALAKPVSGIQSGVKANPKAPAPPAQDPPIVDYQGSTLDKIKQSGVIYIGHRSDVIPISYVANEQPMGYGIDICMDVVQKIKQAENLPNLTVKFVPVTGKNRVPLLREGKIDLECGSTTTNADRRKQVDFSVPYYISGIRILTKNTSGIKSLNDLRGKRISLGAGSTSVELVDNINKQRAMGMKTFVEKDYPSAFADVTNNKSDAFILDDLLLFGTRSTSPDPQNYSVVGEFLSVEPLAIMLRKNDPQFKAVVDKTMVDLINSGQINQVYQKWFESPIPPKNQNLNIPQSALLKDVFRMPTTAVGN